MSVHTVVKIVDGDTFEVSPGWSRHGVTGYWVRPAGLIAPELGTDEGDVARERLTELILNQEVELKENLYLDRGRLICNVLYQGRPLASQIAGAEIIAG